MRALREQAIEAAAPRLLACDLDGTLLDETGHLRRAVVMAVAAVKAAGVHVVIATGRNPWAVSDLAATLGLDGPQIVMNGGACMTPNGEVAWARTMDADLVADAIAFARGLGSSPLLCCLDRHLCEASEDARLVVPDFAAGPRLQQVRSLGEAADVGPIRVYIPTDRRQHARAVAEATEWFGELGSIVFSDAFGLEVMMPDTNKGQALRTLAEAMGLARDEVAAIGDGPNDRQMLAYAGRSAALLPAPGALLAGGSILGEATEIVASSAEDGAVEAIGRFFPELDLGSSVVRPFLPRSPISRPVRCLGPSGWDDDPDPNLDRTAA